ncbi:MAG: hypothetical protein UW27_C0002G0110 [Parcubacteria group bacterium GW2011_GWA1_44_13]|uniref:Uncharacterized protein n=1 Tax=Candidatus Nomurabacteria bacterium GW2011_GWB1_44_12 TaxID=1618748 RepID=A0A837I8A4_9BACT|nr:MAG: hypothetical protein UW17_C0013G0005 [Candidatus Nomurabacteria bacterium GW2011_GWD1_44_10]KKT37165.1 MAG: hypothetical protein UW25_C0002G0111 [Candidatus Nomurabacteria bacterium GW2011_GWB1_44_12]KKT38460.1 MAG: hypothetical protein UW27_C0002G0110 [Parcubacteria group bacterium GW2011_GWA1_44_13]
MTYLCVVNRYKTTCSRNPGITHVSRDKPNDYCPICFRPLNKNGSCAVAEEMTCEQPLKVHKKDGPNIGGPPEPRARSLQNAKNDALARTRNPRMRVY